MSMSKLIVLCVFTNKCHLHMIIHFILVSIRLIILLHCSFVNILYIGYLTQTTLDFYEQDLFQFAFIYIPLQFNAQRDITEAFFYYVVFSYA